MKKIFWPGCVSLVALVVSVILTVTSEYLPWGSFSDIVPFIIFLFLVLALLAGLWSFLSGLWLLLQRIVFRRGDWLEGFIAMVLAYLPIVVSFIALLKVYQ